MSSRLRTLALVLSPRRLPVTLRNLLLWRRMRRNPQSLEIWNRYFDAEYYLATNPDVARARLDPLLHFLAWGNQDFRGPSDFDTRGYLLRYPEVAASGINALLHFASFGYREGRALNDFDIASKSNMPPPVNTAWPSGLPLVSVVIPCFNYGRFVEEAIGSVLAQTFQDFEIIVVEGGSTDAESVAEMRRLAEAGLPKTQFYFRTERHLAGDNRNFGISLARGRYICCLDADDRLHPVYLEVAVFLAEVFAFDLITPSVQCFGDSGERWVVRDPRYPGILEQNEVATAALFRRADWVHIGGFQDWGLGDRHIPEDWDFWIRLLGNGRSARAIAEPLMLYRVHGGGLTAQARVTLDSQRDTLRRANSALESEPVPARLPCQTLHPWANFPRLDDQPGFLLALPYATIGGAEKLFQTLARRIVERGRRLIVVTSNLLPPSMPDDLRSFEELTPHVYRLPTLFSADALRHQFLRYLVHRYAVRHLMLAGSALAYRALPELKSDFPDLTVIDQLFNDTGHVDNNRRYAEQIDLTLVPSERLRESLTQLAGADPAAIRVVPHGIPIPQRTVDEGKDPLPAAARDKIRVAFFGRLSPEKGADLIVEMARKLAPADNLFFVMTGKGPEQERIHARIRKYGLEKRIYAPGFVAEVEPLMRAVDIVVLPSRIDGMPLAVLEAGALEKPVVASKVGSLPAMIADGETGFLCEIADVAAFSRRISQLAADAELRSRMGRAAREKIQREYSVECMLDAYERLFWPLANGAAR